MMNTGKRYEAEDSLFQPSPRGQWIKFNLAIYTLYCEVAIISFFWPDNIYRAFNKEGIYFFIAFAINLAVNCFIVYGLIARKRLAYYLIVSTSVPAICLLVWFLIPFGLDAVYIVPARSFYVALLSILMSMENVGIGLVFLYVFNLAMLVVNIINFVYFKKLAQNQYLIQETS